MAFSMSYENEGSQNEETSESQLTFLPQLWDPVLPLEVNMNRQKYEGIFDLVARRRGFETLMDENNHRPETLSLMDRTSAVLNKLKKTKDKYLDEIATLELENPQYVFPHPSWSALTWLQRYLQVFFARGSHNASQLYFRLDAAVKCQRTLVDKFCIPGILPDQVGIPVPWNSFRISTALVLVLAASSRDMYETLERYTRCLGGSPITLAKVGDTPSQSLTAAMATAKAEAGGPQHLTVIRRTAKTKARMLPKITVLGVNFIDIGYLKNSASIPGFSESHISFSRYFVIGAGPEGFVVWQAGGNGSYGLNEYIDRGSDRIRDWSEAPQFLADFERLAVERVSSRRC